MERLSNVGKLTGVEKLSDRWMYYSGLLACMGVPVDDMKHIQNLIDAEEQEKLIRLPCKVGDTVYCLMSAKTKIVETSILWIEKHSNCLVFALAGGFGDVVSENLGKTWFFTKEEAEQALAKVKEV